MVISNFCTSDFYLRSVISEVGVHTFLTLSPPTLSLSLSLSLSVLPPPLFVMTQSVNNIEFFCTLPSLVEILNILY